MFKFDQDMTIVLQILNYSTIKANCRHPYEIVAVTHFRFRTYFADQTRSGRVPIFQIRLKNSLPSLQEAQKLVYIQILAKVAHRPLLHMLLSGTSDL